MACARHSMRKQFNDRLHRVLHASLYVLAIKSMRAGAYHSPDWHNLMCCRLKRHEVPSAAPDYIHQVLTASRISMHEAQQAACGMACASIHLL
jgi:hypothetical protein